jgi:hypothetical protein
MLMKKLFLFFLLITLATPAVAAELSGRDIMQRSFDRDDGTDSFVLTKMVLIDKNGSRRERLVEMYTKDYDALRKGYIEFLEPADIEGTAFLSWENEGGKDDTQYLYLPALGRARRIVSSQQDLRFVNTDFTYEDMQRRRPSEDTHTRLQDDTFEGHDCYVVKSIPREDNSQYAKRIHWVDKQSLIIVRTLFYNAKGKLVKEFRVNELDKVDGYWTALTTTMIDYQDDHKTVLDAVEVKYDQGLDDTLFTRRQFQAR